MTYYKDVKATEKKKLISEVSMKPMDNISVRKELGLIEWVLYLLSFGEDGPKRRVCN